MSPDNKTIDVVIPTFHIPEQFSDLLKALENQKKKVSRIIIMNTQEETETVPAFPEFFSVSVYTVKPEEFDHGATRHEALLKSEADYVLFLTQDAEVVDDALTEELVSAFDDEKVAVAYGRQLPKADCRALEAFSRSFNYPETSFTKGSADKERLGIKTYFCSDVCAMYDRKKYLELGGFTRKTIFNEDMIFAHAAVESGYLIAYCAEAMVRHSHNYSGIQYLKRNFDLAVSQADHPEVFKSISSEKEGLSLVKKNAAWLISEKKILQIPLLVYISGMKYLGYFLGKRYQKLPEGWVLKLTSNKNYWGK